MSSNAAVETVATLSDVDWKKAFHLLELIAAPMGLSEEIEDIVNECTYERPVPNFKREEKL